MDADFIGEITKLEEHEKLTKLVLMRTQMDVVLDLIYAWENSHYSTDENMTPAYSELVADLVDKIKEKLDPEHTWKPLDENDKPLTNAELEEMKKKYGLK